MSLFLFHQGNVPIIEDDMKFAEIKLENNKSTNPNWAYIGFVTEVSVLKQIITDLIEGRIDGIKLVMDLTASQSPTFPEGVHIIGFPSFDINFDLRKVNIYVKRSGIFMPTDDYAQQVDTVNLSMSMNPVINLADI